MEHFYKKKHLGKVDHLYPMLCAPNDGYDENGRWMGMTPEEVTVWLEGVEQRFFLAQWSPKIRPD